MPISLQKSLISPPKSSLALVILVTGKRTFWRRYRTLLQNFHSLEWIHSDPTEEKILDKQLAFACALLQHTATHCNTLQHTTTHCNTLQHTATHCNTLIVDKQLAFGCTFRDFKYICTCNSVCSIRNPAYGVATISRLLKLIVLFCRILIRLFCKRDL